MSWLDTLPTKVSEAAKVYGQNRWPVFPCAIDKRPTVEGGFKAASASADQITTWWRRWPEASIGWPVPRGHVVIDVDARHRGHESLDELEREHGRLPKTLSSVTGGGGLHLIFKLSPGSEGRQTTGLRPGIDTRTSRGYVIVAPSLHASGLRYAWRDSIQPVEAPGWLMALVRVPPALAPQKYEPHPATGIGIGRRDKYALAALRGEAAAVAETPEGQRNDRLNRAWWRLHKFCDVIPPALARAELTRAALASGLDEQEIARVLR